MLTKLNDVLLRYKRNRSYDLDREKCRDRDRKWEEYQREREMNIRS